MISKVALLDERALNDLVSRFRSALELNANGEYCPLNQCHHICNLFSVYLFAKYPHFKASLVLGHTDKRCENVAGHYWLEVGNTIVDMTMDQFNNGFDQGFSKLIRANSPYKKSYACAKEDSAHYKVFKSFERESLDYKLADFGRDTIDELEQNLRELKQYL